MLELRSFIAWKKLTNFPFGISRCREQPKLVDIRKKLLKFSKQKGKTKCSRWNWKWRKVRGRIRCHVVDAPPLHPRPFPRRPLRCRDYTITELKCPQKVHFSAIKTAKAIKKFAFRRRMSNRNINGSGIPMVGGQTLQPIAFFRTSSSTRSHSDY